MASFEKEDLTSLTSLTLKDENLLKRQAIKGVLFLGLRRITVQIVITGANIVLARILFPQDFGAFAIAWGFVSLMSIFSSLGLEQALIQKEENPHRDEFRTVFTVSLTLSLVMAMITFLVSPLIFLFYQKQLGSQGLFILGGLSLIIPLQALKGISGVILERKLDYLKLTILETWEILILEVSTIVLAVMGFGVLSFLWGTLLSKLLVSLGFLLLAPWPIGFRFSPEEVKKLIGFGGNFQLTTILNGLSATAVPIFVGKAVGSSGLGLLNWAGGLAAFPRGIPEIFSRLAFPVCARTQDDLKLFRTVIEKSVQLSCFTTFPLIAILAALIYPITYLIYTDKWLGGIPAFYFFSMQSVFVVIGGIFTQALLALGEAKIVRNITLFWALLQWVLTVPLVLKFGFNGFAVTSLIVSFFYFLPLFWLRKKTELAITRHVWPYLVFASSTGLIIYFLNQQYPAQNLLTLLGMVMLGCLIYVIQVLLFKTRELVEDFLQLRRLLFVN